MVEKKVSKSRKNLQNREKKFGIQKNISEAKKKKKKKMKSGKKIKIEKKFRNREKCFRIEKYFVTGAEKKS